MTRAERYARDGAAERKIAQFVDENFYMKTALSAHFERCYDKARQFAGCDVRLGRSYIDEKAKYKGKAFNCVYQYPSFELQLVDRGGNLRDGWFASNLSTDWYCFIGISSTAPDETRIAESEILSADLLFVKKADVEELVESETGKARLMSDAQKLRDEGVPDRWGKARLRYPHGKFSLTYSDGYDEKPVNMVVPRQTLEGLPHTRHLSVTRDGVKKED